MTLTRIPRPADQQSEYWRGSPDKPHAFVPGAVAPGGNRDETCWVCERDPRNEVHMLHKIFDHEFVQGHSECARCRRPRAHHATEPTAPQLYDGLTAEQCLERYEHNQRNHDKRVVIQTAYAPCHLPIRYQLTPAQLAAARELWSVTLRQRVHASKKRERRQVVVELDWE